MQLRLRHDENELNRLIGQLESTKKHLSPDGGIAKLVNDSLEFVINVKNSLIMRS